MHRKEKIALVIPAINEEKSVGGVIRSFLLQRGDDGLPVIDLVVVGDNGSSDSTAAVAEAAGAVVVSEPRRGYGSACLAAIAALPSDISIIVFADADSSDEPSELPYFLAALDSGADLVIGSRALGKAERGSLTPQQLFGNWLAAFLIRTIWKHPITDLGPFRAIRRSAYEKLAMADRTYGWTVEMQVKAIQLGLTVSEVPASYHRRIGVSKISGTIRGTIGAGTTILGMIALLWWRERSSARRFASAIALIAVGLWFAVPSSRINAIVPSNSAVQVRSFTLKGIALGMHEGDSFDYGPAIDEIADIGAGAIELVIPYYQQNARSSKMGPKPGATPSLEVIGTTIRRARARGLKVFLLPIILLKSAENDEWRGSMKPSNPDAWWRNYSRLLENLARLAKREDAQGLSVGSELIWSEGKRARWISVIKSVRKQFPGTLLYSANWDHYKPVKFWDRLDAIGISGYFELTRDSEASAESLRSSWMHERDEIISWRKKIGKPVIFTEVGYPAIDGGAVYPWDYTMKGRPDEDEQRRALSAFIETWRDAPELEGAFIYEWGIPERGGSPYSPRGRLAESVVKRWMEER